MKRILLMVLKLFYIAPYWWIMICKFSKDTRDEKYSQMQRYRLLQQLTTRANKAGRVTVICTGTENIPKEDGFVLYPNHQGMFDAMLFYQTIDRPLSVVLKKEVKDVFFVKQCLEAVHGQAMDRQDIRQSMKVIMEVSKEVKEGRNYLVFAEGTRSRKGNEILEFKAGAFKAATSAKAPIVPVAIIDSFKGFDTRSAKPVTAQIHYLQPMYYEEYKDLKTSEIAKIVQERIRSAIKEHTNTAGL